MIIYKKGLLEKIKDWHDGTIYILTDFDKTITSNTSQSSWGFLKKNDNIAPEYIKERNEMYNYYRPIELDTTIDEKIKANHMKKWWEDTINLFIKYKLSKQTLEEATKNPNFMEFREGAKEFLENMHKRNIPVIIISAGISNFIEEFLIKNNCNYDNIYIIANTLIFKDGVAKGITEEIIHSSNKDQIIFPKHIQETILNRPNVILMGDTITDANMTKNTKEHSLKIGFLDEKINENLENYQKEFDVICTNNTSYQTLAKEIKILKD